MSKSQRFAPMTNVSTCLPGLSGSFACGAMGVIRRVSWLSTSTFAPASTPTKLTAAAAKAATRTKATTAKGTTIRYELSAAAAVTITVERASTGRRSGTRCVKATKKLKRKKRCTRYVKVTTLTRVHESGGTKKVPFSGRVGRKALRAGRYRLRAAASDGAGTTSATRTAKFKIVKR